MVKQQNHEMHTSTLLLMATCPQKEEAGIVEAVKKWRMKNPPLVTKEGKKRIMKAYEVGMKMLKI